MTKIIPGSIQSLPVIDVIEKGYRVGFDNDTAFILKRDLKNGTEPGTMVEVFTFYNEERELEATTRLPNLQVGQIGCFRVANSNELGSFIHIGTRRDILIPRKEQGDSLEDGKMALVMLLEDAENRRLYASTRLGKYLNNEEITYQRGDEVTLIIAEKLDIGRRVVVDGKFTAALFRQEMTDRVRLGEKVKGYIRKVEGKDIVVSMQREGVELLDDSKVKLMAYLEMNGGYVRINDDTDPEEIKLRLHMSKKAFKKAAGMLFKEGKVLLTKFGIKMNKTGLVPVAWEKNKIFVDEDKEVNVKPMYYKSIHEDDEDENPIAERKKWVPAKAEAGSAPPKKEFVKRTDERPPVKKFETERYTEDKPREDKPDTGPIKPKKELTFKGKK